MTCPPHSYGRRGFFAEFTLSEANGLRMTLCVRLPRLGAVTPACTKRFGEGRHFGVQARSPAKAGSLAMTY
jgi:hypothetical protein